MALRIMGGDVWPVMCNGPIRTSSVRKARLPTIKTSYASAWVAHNDVPQRLRVRPLAMIQALDFVGIVHRAVIGVDRRRVAFALGEPHPREHCLL
jgi:hypothetical protein